MNGKDAENAFQGIWKQSLEFGARMNGKTLKMHFREFRNRL